MEPVTIHHPVTAASDVLLLLGWTSGLTLLFYLVMGTKWLLNREAIASILNRRASEADMRAAPIHADQMSRLRKFHFSWPTFLLSCLPMLVSVAGGVGCSLLRDAGYMIVPWPVMLNGAALGAAIPGVLIVRRRAIRRLLLGETA